MKPPSLAALEKQGNASLIELSRNFGHQPALSAGLDASRSDLVITMDCDGQHHLNWIPEMIALFKQATM